VTGNVRLAVKDVIVTGVRVIAKLPVAANAS
jgi:hypothetical protein